MKCVACAEELDIEVKSCPVCRQRPAGHPCNVCKKRIPDDAEVCNECKSYQTRGWRFLFKAGTILLSLGTAITIGLNLGNLASALNRNSRTHMKVLTTKIDAEAIPINVWNTGQEPSWVLAARLTFKDPRFGLVRLDLHCCPVSPPDANKAGTAEDCKATNLIKAGEAVTICYKTDKITFPKPGGGEYSKAEALKLLHGKDVTLEIDVEESNNPGLFGLCAHHTLADTFNEEFVEPFLEVRLLEAKL